MNIAEIKERAKAQGVTIGKLKKEELVRAIQASEGNTACFNNGRAASCAQDHCIWRPDCDR